MPIHAQDFPAAIVADDLTINFQGRRYSVAEFTLPNPEGKRVQAIFAGDAVRVEALDPIQFPGCVYVYADPAGTLCGYPLGLALPEPQTAQHPDQVATAIVPASYLVPAHEPLPTGWTRNAQCGAVDLAGFIRESVAIMVRCDLAGTHDTQMQLAAAAASFLVLADAIAPATVPFLRALCWPDDAAPEDDDDGTPSAPQAPAAGGAARHGIDLTRVSVSSSGTFEFDGVAYGCVAAAGQDVYVERLSPSVSRALFIWATDPDPGTEEALQIGVAWPLPPVPVGDLEHA